MRKKVEEYRSSGEDEHEVNEFAFTSQDFDKLVLEDEGSELNFHGQMYDIISIEKMDGRVVIRCFADKKETHYKLLAKRQHSHKKSRVKQVITKLYSSSRPGEYAALGVIRMLKFFASGSHSLPSPFLNILKPPPDLNC
jgi:hypothetical protein